MKRTIVNMPLTIAVYRCEIERHESAHGTYQTTRSVEDGTLSGTVELRIDAVALLRLMGPHALRAKSKRCIRAGGLVEVVAIKETLKRVPAPVGMVAAMVPERAS